MVEREKTKQTNQEAEDPKRRFKHQKAQPLLEVFHAWTDGLFPLMETPFQPQMDKHTAFLAGTSSSELRTNFILHLQQTYGNNYVQRLLESVKVQAKLTVNMPKDVYEQEADKISRLVTRDVASQVQRRPEEEEEGAKVTRITKAVNLPIIMVPGAEDGIPETSGEVYSKTFQGGVSTKNYFGICSPRIWSREIAVTPKERLMGLLSPTYEVSMRLDVDYRWDTDNQGRKHISSASDPDVTPDTWSQIVYDLTPVKSHPSKSPRREYWCRDLTERHEKYHIADYEYAFKLYVDDAATLLKKQKASSVKEATKKGFDMIEYTITQVRNYMGRGASAPAEVRAYGDGAPVYEERAKAVKDRAKKEGWEEGLVMMG